MDFQDLTDKLLLDIKWIQAEAHEGLDSLSSMVENIAWDSLSHCDTVARRIFPE